MHFISALTIQVNFNIQYFQYYPQNLYIYVGLVVVYFK